MNQIFSKEALEAASNPDELDHTLQIVRSKLWIPIFGICVVALVGLTWSIFGRMPVSVTGFGVLINPGNVKSEAWDSTIEYFSPDQELEDWYKTVSQDTPLGRVAEAEEIAALTAFLASKRAGYITGASIDIDGGLTRYI